MKEINETIIALEKEKAELEKDIEKLEDFLTDRKNIKKIGNYHATLLFGQKDAMCIYLTFITLRLNDLKMIGG